MDIVQVLNNRYSTKKFDPQKKISSDLMQKVKHILRMSPSSTNLQPWHFIIAETDEGKQRMAKGVQGTYIFNESKVLNASHVVLFCSRLDANDQYMKTLLDKEDRDGRFPNAEIKKSNDVGRRMFADIHKFELKDQMHWLEKQVYLNIGNFLLGVAALGIDACPMEGIDAKALDTEFDLRAKGVTSIVAVAIGYHLTDDFNAPENTPKSRWAEDQIITVV